MKKSLYLKIAVVVVIVAFGASGMVLLSSGDKESNKKEVDPEVRTVKVENVHFSEINLLVSGNGVIESQRSLNVVAEVSGKVDYSKNGLKTGTFVSKDEVVLEIDKREAENSLYSMRSDFINNVASILPDLKVEDTEVYEKWHNYFLSLDINNTVPRLPEISTSQEKIKISSKNIYTKYYSVKNQEILVSKHTVKAPFSGYIKSDGILENGFINRGEQLFSLEDVNHLEIAVPLLVQDYNLIDFNAANSVSIYSEDNEDVRITGRLVRRDTKLERNSQSLNVYVQFTNSNLLSTFYPGNYVHVDITGKKLDNVAEIPRHVIGNDQEIYTNVDGKLGREIVNILAYQGQSAIIAKTIPENTQIVTTILQKPLVGMSIQTTEDLAKSKMQDKVEIENEEGSLAVAK